MTEVSARERKFLVPIRQVIEARKMGVTLADLNEMLHKSARITHPKGNRRYHDYVFSIVGDRLESLYKMTPEEAKAEEAMLHSYVKDSVEPQSSVPQPIPTTKTIRKYYKCETCQDTGKMRVFDECEVCEGRGCRNCDDGLVPAQVTCPDCQKRDQIGVYQKPAYQSGSNRKWRY